MLLKRPWSEEQVPVDGDITSQRSDVAKEHDVFIRATAFGLLVGARACF